MPTAPGMMLAHYRLVRQIGEGGMGVVWQAMDTRLDREVAIKVLADPVADHPELLKRFEREAKAVAALNHPNIVTLYSVEEAEGRRFITMELVQGETLRDAIPSGGFTLRRFLELALPFTDALAAAHDRRIVHRDLKPANVMLGEDGRLKVLDFGLAKLRAKPTSEGDPEATLHDTHQHTRLTEAGQILGTVAYMSPEQLHGEPVDHRSDLFSAGIMLYEMATGERPFQGKSHAELMSAILRDSPPAVTDRRAGLPDHLGRIVARCLEKDVESRYQSAVDLRDDLEDLRDEVSASELGRKVPVRRGRRLVPALAAIAGIALLVVAAFWFGRDRSPTGVRRDAIAVLPLVNLTGDPARDYLGAGVSAGLISDLAEVSGVQVVGRTEAWRDGGGGVHPSDLARNLGVRTVLEGEVREVAGELRIQVKLTDAVSGMVLWSETFSGDGERLFDLQDEITRELVTVLSVSLSESEALRLARDPTRSYQAYDYLLQGYQLVSSGDVRSLDAAAVLFRQAVRLDDEFALAHAALSDALWLSYQDDPATDKLSEAERAARRALDLDPGLPEAQVAIARVYRSTGRYAESIDQLESLLDEHPKPAEAHRALAASYERVGDLDAAETCYRAAAALGAGDWSNWNALGAFLEQLGRYDEAREAFEEAAVVAPPDVGIPLENVAVITILQGRFDEAIEAYERVPRPIRSAELASNIGTAYYFSSRPDRWENAESYYRLAARLDPRDPVIRRNLADLYGDLGRREDSLHHYGEALLLVEDALRDDPRNATLRLEQSLYAAKAEKCDKAVPLAVELSAELPETTRDTHRLAQIFALCGREREALEAIRAAIGLGFSPEIIGQETEFAALRDHPEFADLVAAD